MAGICAKMQPNGAALGKQESSHFRDRLPPEARLILACARASGSPGAGEEIQHLLKQPLDWPYVHRIAFRNGAIPFLDRELGGMAGDFVPEDSRRALRAFTEGLRDQNHFLLNLALELHSCFARQGIPALAYVEAISSFASYGRPDLRACTWVDFVVRPADLPAAQALLQRDGRWQELKDPASEIQPARRRTMSIWGDGPRDSALCLQTATAPWPRAIRMDLQEVWGRAVEASFDGNRVPSLSPEDTILHLCVQNSEYLWVTLQGITDLAQVVRAHPALNWEDLLARARRCGILRMLALGMRLTESLLDCPLPQQVRAEIEKDTEIPALEAALVRGFFESAPTSSRTPEMLRMHLRLRERATDRARYLWRFLISPTEVERNLMRLPAKLHFLYPWIRPLRLAGSALRRVAGRPVRKALQRPESVSGYSPSPANVVHRMLELAEVRPGDVVYDLGCGDGRIVIEAARRFGVRGTGMDLDPQRIRECKQNAAAAGVEHLVSFCQQDVMRAELPAATVVFMYLPPKPSLQLAARLMQELPPGARIVSHNADPGGWDRVEACTGQGFPSLVYLRRVPARAPAAESK